MSIREDKNETVKTQARPLNGRYVIEPEFKREEAVVRRDKSQTQCPCITTLKKMINKIETDPECRYCHCEQRRPRSPIYDG